MTVKGKEELVGAQCHVLDFKHSACMTATVNTFGGTQHEGETPYSKHFYMRPVMPSAQDFGAQAQSAKRVGGSLTQFESSLKYT